jgi:DNA-binding transcriptional LysR family regulator
MQDGLEWSDLKLLLAIVREGGLAPAARALGVNHSTAFRRLAALEARLGEALFDRRGGRYEATAFAELLLEGAERVELEMQALERRLAGQEKSLEGSLRITAPDDIAHLLLAPLLARFREQHPGILLECIIDNRMLSLSKREADIALRPTPAPEETLVGRRVAGLPSTVYAARRRLEDWTPEPAKAPWIAWEEARQPLLPARFLAERYPAAQVVYRSNSMLQKREACAAGVGLAFLPCALGDPDGRLARLAPPEAPYTAALWLLTHPDLRQNPRVRACMDFLFEELKAQRPLLEGRSPQ